MRRVTIAVKPSARALAAFVLPFVVFSVFLSIEGFFPLQHYLIYPWKCLATAAVIVCFSRELPSLRPGRPFSSVLIGFAAFIIWIGLDPWLVRHSAAETGLNPFTLYPPGLAWILFAFRVVGIALVVPVMEELFWRGFLMRWLIREDFTTVVLGTFTPVSFFVTTAFFAGVHGVRWPLAVIVGLLYGAWFIKTKKLGDIMLAHGVTNLFLALFCLQTGDWYFLATVAAPPR